ncbi:HIT family protein [Symmachiella dynata]|uniref:HIT family protein n=1 Tax=Symmachiella dynata TaxID=2527995 RepID=UPI0030EDC449
MADKTVFTRIIDGELPCAKVYEDDQVFAFMSREAIRPGHALVIPKDPVPDFFDLGDDVIVNIMRVAKQLAKAIESEFHPRRVGLVVAGFDVPHAHLHVIPMHEYHDITSKNILEDAIQETSMDELEANAARLRKAFLA